MVARSGVIDKVVWLEEQSGDESASVTDAVAC
jgi:hypothetical protein